MIKDSELLSAHFSSTTHGGRASSPQNPSLLFWDMDSRALTESFDKLPIYIWAHSNMHTVVYNNQLARETFGDCRGQLCHQCLMGRKDICKCCKAENILKNNVSEVCKGCRRGGNGHAFDTFHSPVIMKERLKFVLKFSIISDEKKTDNERRNSKAAMKDLSVNSIRSMCASCKKIKEPANEWITVEKYLHDDFGVNISHGICQECMARLYPDLKI